MTDMMADVIKRGTGVRARSLGRSDIAGKTGTTNEAKDTWFNGFTPNLVATVWVGYDQERPLGEREEGARTALPIWIQFMREALKGVPDKRRPMPEGLVQLRVSSRTGELVGPENPDGYHGNIHGGSPARRQRQKTVRWHRVPKEGHRAQSPFSKPFVTRMVPNMSRHNVQRSENLRRALAQEAARIMAEHGIRDFLIAKRKAAERMGVSDTAPRCCRGTSRSKTRSPSINACSAVSPTLKRCVTSAGPRSMRCCICRSLSRGWWARC